VLDLAALQAAMESEQACTYHIPAHGPWRPAEHIPCRITGVWTDFETRRYGSTIDSPLQTAIECVWVYDVHQRPHIIQSLDTIRACITIEEATRA
jgi:hypothetical protein